MAVTEAYFATEFLDLSLPMKQITLADEVHKYSNTLVLIRTKNYEITGEFSKTNFPIVIGWIPYIPSNWNGEHGKSFALYGLHKKNTDRGFPIILNDVNLKKEQTEIRTLTDTEKIQIKNKYLKKELTYDGIFKDCLLKALEV